MTDLVDISGSKLDERTNALLVSCKSAPMGEDANDAPGFEDAPMFGSGCVTGRPWPKDGRGMAQAIVDRALAGSSGVVTGWRDARVSDVVAQLGEGEGCLHSTGPGFDSRVFVKDQLVSIVVGNDTTITVDRKNKKISIAGFGATFQISESSGISMACEGSLFQMKGGVTVITGQVVLGGRSPTAPVQFGLVPVVGGVGGASNPAPGVFVGT